MKLRRRRESRDMVSEVRLTLKLVERASPGFGPAGQAWSTTFLQVTLQINIIHTFFYLTSIGTPFDLDHQWVPSKKEFILTKEGFEPSLFRTSKSLDRPETSAITTRPLCHQYSGVKHSPFRN